MGFELGKRTGSLFPAGLGGSLFDDPIFDGWGNALDMLINRHPIVSQGGYNKSMRTYDEGETLRIEFDLPGMTSNDINVSIDEQVITITAEKKNDGSGSSYHNRYSYRVALPDNCEQPESAEVSNGVLELSLPKKTVVESSKVDIEVRDK